MRPGKTFVFHHHEHFGPFSLEELRSGEARFGGSVARLRLLFALARRGHDVWLIGNVHDGSCDGVRARRVESLREFSLEGREVTLIFNNPPPEEQWLEYRANPWSGATSVIWAGNHFERLWMERLERRDVDRIVCVSRWHREFYRVFRGFERLEVSYSGIDKDFLLPRDLKCRRTVLSLSVPRRTKGLDRLLEAWRLVRREQTDAQLLISGASRMHDPNAPIGPSGLLDADLEASFPDIFADGARSLAASGVELLGRRSLPEVYAALSEVLFAVVNPSHNSPETYCRAAVEAQAAGVAVVGARSGALPEVIADGRTGLLAEDSAESLAQHMLRLLRDPDLALDMGRHGRIWSNWLADYDLIAPDWEFIAERAQSDEPAPAEPREAEDRLRAIGYGSARNWIGTNVAVPVRQLLGRARRRFA